MQDADVALRTEKEYPREEWINQGMDPEEGADGEDKDAKNRDKLTKTRDEGVLQRMDHL